MKNRNFFTALLIGALLAVALLLFVAAENTTSRSTVSYIQLWADAGQVTRPQWKNWNSAAVVDSVGWITGTGTDTTALGELAPYMTLTVEMNDTSNTDSTGSRIDLYTAVNNQYRRNKTPVFGEFRLAASFTASGDTTLNITASPIFIHQYYFFLATGLAGNKKASAVSQKLTLGLRDF